MNINRYIKKYGQLTFEEFPFNGVDALIMAELVYINFDHLLNEGETCLVIGDIVLPKNTRKIFFDGSPDALYNKTMLKNMIASKRYSSLIVGDFLRKFSNETVNQFFAMTVRMGDKMIIAFRGTDITLIGWKEDLMLTYESVLLSHYQAIDYANKILEKYDDNFYIIGHSKGGNLAFYTACNLDDKDIDRLIEAYSFDGPGFKDGIERFKSYEKVKGKLKKYLTFFDAIGLVYNNIDNYKVVHSTGILFGGHDPFFWQIDSKKGDFMYAKKVAKSSKTNANKLMKWLNYLTYDDRVLVVDAIFEVFKQRTTIYDLLKMAAPDIIRIKKSLKKYSDDEQKRLKMIFKTLLKFFFLSNNKEEVKKIEEKK